MANYNQTTQEIARPSDLLAGIRSYTANLHSLSSYISVDVTRLVKSVLLQQTQPLDSHGGPTITTLYTNWCVSHTYHSQVCKNRDIFTDTCSMVLLGRNPHKA